MISQLVSPAPAPKWASAFPNSFGFHGSFSKALPAPIQIPPRHPVVNSGQVAEMDKLTQRVREMSVSSSFAMLGPTTTSTTKSMNPLNTSSVNVPPVITAFTFVATPLSVVPPETTSEKAAPPIQTMNTKTLGEPHPLHGVCMYEPYKLYPHQEEAVNWIVDKETNAWHGIRGGIVSLEMGLGKTLISFFIIARTLLEQKTPTLVLCSLSLLATWRTDWMKFFGHTMRILFLHEKEMTRKQLLEITKEELCRYHVIVTTYDVVRTGAKKMKMKQPKIGEKVAEVSVTKSAGEILFELEWYRVIADESQRFANYKGKLLEALLRLRAPRKICLSGTPIKNYAEDLYSQFRFCNFIKVPTTKQWSPQAYRHYKLRRNILLMTFETARMPRVEKEEKIAQITLQGKEKQIYGLFWRLSAMTLERLDAGTSNFGALLASFTRLRQACIAPHLIHPAGKLSASAKAAKQKQEKEKEKKRQEEKLSVSEQEHNGEEEEDATLGEDEFKKMIDSLLGHAKREREVQEIQELYQWISDARGTAGMRSQKNNEIVRILREEIRDPEKTIIFSTFASELILLQQRFLEEGIGREGSVFVDGSVKSGEREVLWNKFRHDPRCRVLLMTFKVGSEGITLVEGNNIILIEPWWNSSVSQQSIARAWRIGQTRKVNVWHILTRETIEDRILEKCQEKEALARKYLGTGKAPPTDSEMDNPKKCKGAALKMIRSFITEK